jgi:protein TonB
MNKIFFLIVFICFIQISLGQETKQSDSLLIAKIKEDVVPVPKETKLYQYVMQNYRLPDVPGLKGKVLVNFVVNEDGSIGDFEIVENVGYGTAEELIRVLKTTNGKWKAPIKDGKPVKVKYYLPLRIAVP